MAKEKIITRRIAGHKAYFFRYDAERSGPNMGFEFSLLCEVGQPYIPTFEQIIKDKGLDLVTIEIQEKPWVITVERGKVEQNKAEQSGAEQDTRPQRVPVCCVQGDLR